MTKIFLSLAVFWLLFWTLKGPNGFLAFLVPRLGPRNLKIIWEILKSIEKSPLPISCFFGSNPGTRNAKNPFGPFKVQKCKQKTAKVKKN